LMDQLLSCFYQ
jgi:hypothetical protein